MNAKRKVLNFIAKNSLSKNQNKMGIYLTRPLKAIVSRLGHVFLIDGFKSETLERGQIVKVINSIKCYLGYIG